jgi:hypothetical protein
LLIAILPFDGPLQFGSRNFPLFGQAIREDGNVFPVEKIEYSVVDASFATTKLVNAVPKYIGMWPA